MTTHTHTLSLSLFACRYALVADTVNRAIRVLDLYTQEVWTALTNVGYPTDIVSFGSRVVITDALNHVLWEYTSATLATVASKQPWDTSGGKWGVLTGSAGGGLEGQYAEGDAATAKFWEPLGVAYDTLRHMLYVADYRNRVIRIVDPDTGDTSLLVGDPTMPAAYLDNVNGSDAMITGPTTLLYDAEEDVLLFSDRKVYTDPADDTGAIRKLHLTGSGQVTTVVGKKTRQQGDGTVDAPLVSTFFYSMH